MDKRDLTIGLVGNPNCGKTTLFNGLTGANQHIGNWPGVTVEKKEGFFQLDDKIQVKLVDLPGIYSLSATSEDEIAALDFILTHEADMYLNVVDATCIERSLYLTLLLRELKVPTVLCVTMCDLADKYNIQLDLAKLSERLGVPVVRVNGTHRKDIKNLKKVLKDVKKDFPNISVDVKYAPAVEDAITKLSADVVHTANDLGVSERWVLCHAFENDQKVLKRIESNGEKLNLEEIKKCVKKECGEDIDIVLSKNRYDLIARLCSNVVVRPQETTHLSEKIDKVVLNRFLGIPIFFGIMYVVFWLTQVVGGAFIDFFDILGGTIFVDGFGALLESMNAPTWIVALLAGGAGAGIQTVMTFLPPIFFMFACLSILEDSGYMARAAFVMDRLLRWLGLPGKSFVPMLVGFGCTVPAIMATRTLESKRDRFLTIFMTPFMSCGAKLPVWVVFGAAFFSENPGRMVFYIYISGVLLGIATGLLMKHTLFKGEPSRFIMELPSYHIPRGSQIMIRTWERLKIFIFRAGKLIVPMVLVLGLLNSIGKDGSFGNEDSENSVLSSIGHTLTPIFEPMGVEKDNWPATVSIFTGLFAKEAVIGTLESLYGQNSKLNDNTGIEVEAEEDEGFSFWGGIKDAFASIPEGLSGVVESFTDPLGLGDVSNDEEDVAETLETDASVFVSLKESFSQGRHQAFAYLLFILLYVPCLAATGAAYRELGKLYASLFVGYLTVLGWCVATLYYQLTLGHSALWIIIPVVLLVVMFGAFAVIGTKKKVEMI